MIDPASATLISTGLNIAGKLFGRKPKRVTGVQSMMENAEGAIKAQETYGINALEMLRAGGGNNATGYQPRVGTMAAMSQAFDQIEDVLTGRQAKESAARDVQDELSRIELETRKAELSTIGKKPRIMTQGLRDTPKLADGKINTAIDDGGTGTTLKPRERVVTSDGSTVDMTVGPDIDELLTGGLVEGVAKVRNNGLRSLSLPDVNWKGIWEGESGKMNDITQESRTKDINAKKPIEWDNRFGARKPKGWGRWDNKEKMDYIYRNNR